MDELPIYPTPQQAVYGASSSSQSQPSRKKPSSSSSKPYAPYQPSPQALAQNGYPQYQQQSGYNQSPPHHKSSSTQNYSQPPPSSSYAPPPAQASAQPAYSPSYQPSSSRYQQPPPPQQQQRHHSQPHDHHSQAPPPQQHYNHQAPPPQQSHHHQPPPPREQPRHASASSAPPANPPQYSGGYNQPPIQQPPVQQSPSYSQSQPYQPPQYQQPAPAPMSKSHSSPSHGGYEAPPAPVKPHSTSDSTSSKQSQKQKLDQELRAVFDKVDTDRSGTITARELSSALLNFDRSPFNPTTIRLMIKLFSTSPGGGSGDGQSLNFDQFVSLWKYLSAYKKLFIQADQNRSGDISFGEFQKVLEQIGYKLNTDLVLHLFTRFAAKNTSDPYSVGVGKLKFDGFIELLVYLRKLTDVFKKYDKEFKGVATIDFSDFLFEVSNLN
ncbi:hypothetical protein DIURU_005255 [Diutina rugosa]|uniref:EF-hand domain-containing protein n=1 Tax=Diutina rugosa TaxID=5481 RepID=A0A642UDR7_DIURU|nr:uncharacterized protein DIURU_005255 [Diutina rugosa]KAA8897278.1 hypothetical protein DIURU_005255 [Diutina rugosa]